MSGQVVVSHTYMLCFKNLEILVEDEPEVTDHSQICWNIPIVQPGGKTSDFTPSSHDQANQEKGLGQFCQSRVRDHGNREEEALTRWAFCE